MATAVSAHQAYKLHVSVTANGEPQPETVVTINGIRQSWVLPSTSNHQAYYLGVIEIMAKAIQSGATSVSVELGDQVATRQLNGLDDTTDKGMRVLFEAVRRLETRIPGGVTYV